MKRRIRNEGALKASDFHDDRNQPRGTWWDWKPAKSALETMLDTGDLMVSAREGFQRVYDLTERVLPADLDTSLPDADELARFGVR